MKLRKLNDQAGLSFYLEILDEHNRKIEKWRNKLKDLPKVLSIIDSKHDINILGSYKKYVSSDDLRWAK